VRVVSRLLSGKRLYLGIVGAFAVSAVTAWIQGIEFDTSSLAWFWQHLDEEILRNDLLRGIFYLHSQPPLWNLFLGAVLKLFPSASPAVWAALFQGMALALLLAMAWLMRRLAVPDLVTLALCGLFALQPTFLIYGRWLFYTLPIALLVALSAVVVLRFAETGRPAWAIAFGGVAAMLMLTRAIFHPLWFVAAVFLVALPLEGAARRRLILAALVPLAIVLLWYAKNAAQTGSFGASSWLGMNLRKGWYVQRWGPTAGDARLNRDAWSLSWDETQSMLATGSLPAEWLRVAFAPPLAFAELGYFRPKWWRAPTHPAIDAVYKQNGMTNYNHRDYARISEVTLRGSLAVMWAYPDRYLRRVARASGMFLQPGPRTITGHQESRPALYERTERWNRILYLSDLTPRLGGESPNLLYLVFPGVIAFAALRSFSGDPPRRALFAYAGFTLGWFFLCANLLEIGENDRMRFEIDPLVVVLLGCVLTGLGGAISRAWK
jgi:hypothetical protein